MAAKNSIIEIYGISFYHLKIDLQKVRFSNVSGFRRVGFQIPTTLYFSGLHFTTRSSDCRKIDKVFSVKVQGIEFVMSVNFWRKVKNDDHGVYFEDQESGVALHFQRRVHRIRVYRINADTENVEIYKLKVGNHLEK